MKSAEYWITHLELEPHPEGGYYKEAYKSKCIITKDCLPGFSGDRSIATAIYYLLSNEDISLFHSIKSDEIWHFYYGSPLIIHVLHIDGAYEKIKLGTSIDEGEVIQCVVPAQSWFSAEVAHSSSFGLVGCTVSPGFDFRDFTLAHAHELIKLFPQHEKLIKKFTK